MLFLIVAILFVSFCRNVSLLFSPSFNRLTSNMIYFRFCTNLTIFIIIVLSSLLVVIVLILFLLLVLLLLLSPPRPSLA